MCHLCDEERDTPETADVAPGNFGACPIAPPRVGKNRWHCERITKPHPGKPHHAPGVTKFEWWTGDAKRNAEAKAQRRADEQRRAAREALGGFVDPKWQAEFDKFAAQYIGEFKFDGPKEKDVLQAKDIAAAKRMMLGEPARKRKPAKQCADPNGYACARLPRRGQNICSRCAAVVVRKAEKAAAKERDAKPKRDIEYDRYGRPHVKAAPAPEAPKAALGWDIIVEDIYMGVEEFKTPGGHIRFKPIIKPLKIADALDKPAAVVYGPTYIEEWTVEQKRTAAANFTAARAAAAKERKAG